MRIRKNAKLFQPSSTHLRCQLNQSPWDVITFPLDDSSSPLFHFQEDEDFGFAGNGSFVDSTSTIQSAGSVNGFMDGEEMNKDNGEEIESQVGFNKVGNKEVDNENQKMCARNLRNRAILGSKILNSVNSEPARRGRHPTKKSSWAKAKAEAKNFLGLGPRRGKKKGTGKTNDDCAGMDDDIDSTKNVVQETK